VIRDRISASHAPHATRTSTESAIGQIKRRTTSFCPISRYPSSLRSSLRRESLHGMGEARRDFPASMTGYFDDLAAALDRTGVTEEELATIAQAHAMEIVGPPSERYL
jgi:hypothetical protein